MSLHSHAATIFDDAAKQDLRKAAKVGKKEKLIENIKSSVKKSKVLLRPVLLILLPFLLVPLASGPCRTRDIEVEEGAIGRRLSEFASFCL